MTSPFTSLADRQAAGHPLARCEFCGLPVPEARADCPNPQCQAQARAVDALFIEREARAHCPYCAGPVAGLLAGCDNRDCLRRSLDAETAFVRTQDGLDDRWEA